MSKFGLKIRNYEAAVLYEHNKGIRDYASYTNAMFSNSLLLDYLKTIGLKVTKNEATADIICIKFSFGCRDYAENRKRIEKQLKNEEDPEQQEFLKKVLEKIESRKDLYEKIGADELRRIFYTEGVTIKHSNKTIHYQMLFRTPGKAKEGSVMFINQKLFKKAQHFIRMGIKMPKKNAPIVEMGAYSSLISSSIVDRIRIDPDEILVIPDVESTVYTDVISIETDEQKHCMAKKINGYPLKNVLFDGQALIDTSIFPEWGEGYILLRHHFCKCAAFNTSIQQFFKDNLDDYENAYLTDYWGRKVRVKNVKLITTENALKFIKFNKSFEYWADWVRQNDCMFGIVKTAHPSKIGDLQRMSYQMVNALDLSSMKEVAQESKDYIHKLKFDDEFFLKFLEQNQNFVNDYEVLLALVRHNPEFIRCEYFRDRRLAIIRSYIMRFKNGKLLQNGDNLVIVGNPYGMLMASIGLDAEKDPTFSAEFNCTQCYTERFEDGEFLAEFRSPLNSRNNVGVLHNVRHSMLTKYCHVGRQCIAINMVGSEFQSRNNGSDQDSDSIYTTNQKEIVEHARHCNNNYPTIENNIPKEKTIYDNTLECFAAVDSKLMKANTAIGESSNLAQLALTYSYNFKSDVVDDSIAILSVLAQIAIDNAKRSFDVDFIQEIKRIKQMLDVDSNGLPYFWFMLKRKGRFAASADDEPKNMDKLNPGLVCPMNYVAEASFFPPRTAEECLPMDYFFENIPIEKDRRCSKRLEAFIEKYCASFQEKISDPTYEAYEVDEKEFNEMMEDLKRCYIPKHCIGVMSNLIDRAFRISPEMVRNKTVIESNLWRNKPLLTKILYTINPEAFLNVLSKNLN